MEEQQATYEITATDFINQHLLNAFKQHIDQGNVPAVPQQHEEGNSEEWDDSDYKHEDLPTAQVIGEAENKNDNSAPTQPIDQQNQKQE